MKTIEGSSIIVTGGGSGVGRATVLALAAAGARVVSVGRDRARLERESPPPELGQARARFLELVAELRPELHRYCARLTGSIVDGEDVVQDALPIAQRSAVILKEVLGCSLDEIVASTGASLPAVKAALYRGRTTLRARAAAGEATTDTSRPARPRGARMLLALRRPARPPRSARPVRRRGHRRPPGPGRPLTPLERAPEVLHSPRVAERSHHPHPRLPLRALHRRRGLVWARDIPT